MTKNELVERVYDVHYKMHKCDINCAIMTALEIIGKELVRGEKVQLAGFGTFSVTTRAPREGTNPRTGETINLPETKRVHFSASKTLKDALNK